MRWRTHCCKKPLKADTEYTCTQFNSSYSTSAIPGDLISSILRIIFTSCVAKLICCFLASNVSITCCERMSGGCEGGGAEGGGCEGGRAEEEREGGRGSRGGKGGGKREEGVREGEQRRKGRGEEGEDNQWRRRGKRKRENVGH